MESVQKFPWDVYKEELRRLFLAEDKSLSDVMTYMENEHNFRGSKAQYERYFKKWKFRKNFKDHEWKFVHYRVERRKRGAKASNVYVDGVLIPEEKVMKETSRHNFQTIQERCSQALSPKTPEGFYVCTPQSTSGNTYLLRNLPWEYEARTMSSTWAISLDQVRRQDKDAAELLTFLAYFSNRDIWYDLIRAGAHDDVPWLRRVTESEIQFQRAMSKLKDYNLVDVVTGSYQIHPRLHDWLVDGLNTLPNTSLFIAALTCIAHNVEDESSPQFWATSRRLLEHVEHVDSPRFYSLWQHYPPEERALYAANTIAGLQQNWDRYEKAEQMYMRALAGREKVLGPDHTSTLTTIGNLGRLYRDQGKLEAAEQMYIRALAGIEKALGPDHTLTLIAISNLGNLYRDQGKLEAAEQMYIRALAGIEKVLGPDHTSTLTMVDNLGNLYRDQGKLEAAEQMYMRALAGMEKVLGPDHTWTLITISNLGNLYYDQDKLEALIIDIDSRDSGVFLLEDFLLDVPMTL